MLFEQWSDPEWLVDFFLAKKSDLTSYFKITDINQAIYDTIDDSQSMQCLILDISPNADLDRLFRPLENSRINEMLLGKEKAKIKELLASEVGAEADVSFVLCGVNETMEEAVKNDAASAYLTVIGYIKEK